MSLRLRHYGRIHAIPLRHMHIRAVSSTPTPRFTFQVSLTGVILGVGGVSAFVYANYKVTRAIPVTCVSLKTFIQTTF